MIKKSFCSDPFESFGQSTILTRKPHLIEQTLLCWVVLFLKLNSWINRPLSLNTKVHYEMGPCSSYLRQMWFTFYLCSFAFHASALALQNSCWGFVLKRNNFYVQIAIKSFKLVSDQRIGDFYSFCRCSFNTDVSDIFVNRYHIFVNQSILSTVHLRVCTLKGFTELNLNWIFTYKHQSVVIEILDPFYVYYYFVLRYQFIKRQTSNYYSSNI